MIVTYFHGDLAQVTYAEGCSIAQNNTDGFPAALAAVGSADATVVIVGTHCRLCSRAQS